MAAWQDLVAARGMLRVSVSDVARWSGVARHSVDMFELEEDRVGPETRSRLLIVYQVLHRLWQVASEVPK